MTYRLPPGLPGLPLKPPTADDEPEIVVVGQPSKRGRPPKTDGKFQPGHDPRRSVGRKLGSTNRVNQWLYEQFDANAPKIVKAILRAASNGDMAAAKIVMDRMSPKPRSAPIIWPDRPTDIDLSKPEDRLRMLAAIGEAVANGQLAPDEGQSLAAMIEAVRRSDELDRIASDIEQIKKAMGLSR